MGGEKGGREGGAKEREEDEVGQSKVEIDTTQSFLGCAPPLPLLAPPPRVRLHPHPHPTTPHQPTPAKTHISSEIGIFKTSPVNLQVVRVLSIPEVPSKTWTTARDPLISSTWPWRTSPLPSVSSTISAYLGNLTFSRMTRGPATPEIVR